MFFPILQSPSCQLLSPPGLARLSYLRIQLLRDDGAKTNWLRYTRSARVMNYWNLLAHSFSCLCACLAVVRPIWHHLGSAASESGLTQSFCHPMGLPYLCLIALSRCFSPSSWGSHVHGVLASPPIPRANAFQNGMERPLSLGIALSSLLHFGSARPPT